MTEDTTMFDAEAHLSPSDVSKQRPVDDEPKAAASKPLLHEDTSGSSISAAADDMEINTWDPLTTPHVPEQSSVNNQQPAVNNQQPPVNNQQPPVNNQQPPVNNQPLPVNHDDGEEVATIFAAGLVTLIIFPSILVVPIRDCPWTYAAVMEFGLAAIIIVGAFFCIMTRGYNILKPAKHPYPHRNYQSNFLKLLGMVMLWAAMGSALFFLLFAGRCPLPGACPQAAVKANRTTIEDVDGTHANSSATKMAATWTG